MADPFKRPNLYEVEFLVEWNAQTDVTEERLVAAVRMRTACWSKSRHGRNRHHSNAHHAQH